MKLSTLGLFALGFLFSLPACSAGATKQSIDDPGWPIVIERDGRLVKIYQLQPESLTGDRLTGRAAVEVTREGGTEPQYGTLWIDARISTDRDARAVTLLDAQVDSIKFPGATPEVQEELAKIVRAELPQEHPTFSLDELITTLDPAVQAEPMASDLRNEPPHIVFVTKPTALVTIDGKPVLRDIEKSKLQRVINTAFVILFDPAQKAWWLEAGSRWLRAEAITGPWTYVPDPPQEVTNALPPATLAGRPDAKSDDVDVMVATEPTEIIVSEGEPRWTPIDGTGLSYMSNSESDVFRDGPNGTYYALLAGRWYSTSSLANGPWKNVAADALPEGFAKIPADSEKADVRTFVAGTNEAREAVIDASIPQTAAIKKSDAHNSVTYDGPPRFAEIPGTPLKYAVNTSSSVIQYGDRFYCCTEGVWYVAGAPTGPWSVATDVPNEIYSIPPSCPVYPVKYCYVYDSTPEYVYVGYLPGYTGCYVSGPTVVYGTGYWYPGWVGVAYYPYPCTWGFYPHYDPWFWGWSFGFGFAWGVHSNWFCNAHHVGHPGWWGPGGFHGHGYEMHGDIVHHIIDPSAPGSGGNIVHGIASGRENVYRREGNTARLASVPGIVQHQQRIAPSAVNELYAGHDGNVVRRTQDGAWEERQRGAWQRTTPQPAAGQGRGPGAGRIPSGEQL